MMLERIRQALTYSTAGIKRGGAEGIGPAVFVLLDHLVILVGPG